jgi:hypothetical protein
MPSGNPGRNTNGNQIRPLKNITKTWVLKNASLFSPSFRRELLNTDSRQWKGIVSLYIIFNTFLCLISHSNKKELNGCLGVRERERDSLVMMPLSWCCPWVINNMVYVMTQWSRMCEIDETFLRRGANSIWRNYNTYHTITVCLLNRSFALKLSAWLKND